MLALLEGMGDAGHVGGRADGDRASADDDLAHGARERAAALQHAVQFLARFVQNDVGRVVLPLGLFRVQQRFDLRALGEVGTHVLDVDRGDDRSRLAVDARGHGDHHVHVDVDGDRAFQDQVRGEIADQDGAADMRAAKAAGDNPWRAGNSKRRRDRKHHRLADLFGRSAAKISQRGGGCGEPAP